MKSSTMFSHSFFAPMGSRCKCGVMSPEAVNMPLTVMPEERATYQQHAGNSLNMSKKTAIAL